MKQLEYAEPCKKCKNKPFLKASEGFCYIQCHGRYKNKKDITVACHKWHYHEFMAINEKTAVENWNSANQKNIY